jgi:iron complex outermembrane receptor protein
MARTLLAGALVCLALTRAQPAGAQTPRPEESSRKEYSLNLEAQPLTRALEQLYGQTGVFYGYSPNSPEEEAMIVGPLRGKYTIEEALNQLLRSTGLTFIWTNSRQISIVRAPPAPKPRMAPQTNAPRKAPAPTQRDPARDAASDAIIETVYTTGYAFKSLKESAGSFVIMDREAIERSGFTTVSDLLKYLPQQPYLKADGFSSSGAQYAEFRGLGTDTTMVLVNGHRAFASAASFVVNAFDLNTIPLSAVERVELLFDSTSVRHGMDAIGGVLNIVLRDEVPRPDVQVHYGSAAGGGEQFQTSASAGFLREGVKAALIADYTTTQTLLGIERDLWANQDYRRYGSTDQRSPFSNPANVTALSGNLPGQNTPFAAVVGPGQFRFGEVNRESLLQYFPIVPATSRASVSANAEVEIWPTDIVASAEVMFVDRSVRFPTVSPVTAAMLLPLTSGNPFTVPVLVNTRLDGMDRQTQNIDSTLLRGVASLRGKARAWDWETAILRSEEDARLTVENLLDQTKFLQGLASQSLDLFRPGPAASQEVLDSLVLPPDVDNYATDATQIVGSASGQLFELPGGLITAMLGGEWRKESVQFDAALDSFEREVGAGFVELTIPVFGADMHVPALRELKLVAGGRLDDYSDFGQIFNPQFGLRWLPYEDFSLHASYGRSFRPPSMYELYLPRQESLPVFQVVDPRRGGAPTTVSLISGGNPELEPTRGESFTGGFVFSPQALDPVEIFANYWHLTMDERVTLLLPQLVLTNEALFPERVIRAEPTPLDLAAGVPGRVVQIDTSRMNFGRLATSGIDLGVRYQIESPFGVFTGNAVATYIDEFETIDVPATPAASRINVANQTVGTITKWRAVAGLDWDRNALSATMHVRYIPSYDDTRNGVRNGRRIGAQTFLDLQAAVDLGKLAPGSPLLRGVELATGASNLFDEQPDFAEVVGAAGYDTSQGDLKGRFWYVRLGKTF